MQLWGSLHLVGPVSALLTVLAFIHLSRSSSPASSSSHLFHQWSRGSPRATSSSTTKATTVHAPAATEATSVSTTAASEHSTRTTAVHEATSSSPHASRATSAAVTAQGWERRWEEAFRLWDLTLVALCSPGEVLVPTARVGARPVSSSVLHVSSSSRVPPGTVGPSWWEASSVYSAASHVPHGSSRTSWAPWTSSERQRHPPALTRGHPSLHAVHGWLLPSKRHFKFAPLEIFPIKPLDSSFGSWWVFIRHRSITFGLSCFLVQVNMDHGLSSPLIHFNDSALLKEVHQVIESHTVVQALHVNGTVVRVFIWIYRWA